VPLEATPLKLRGYVALAIVCLGLLAADPIQRLFIAPWVKLRPARRVTALGRWIQFLAWYVTAPLVRLGGASVPVPNRVVPAEPGHLILMNHQSLFDIPLVVQTVDSGYVRIVTRERYGRSIPLISHMVRLYQYPLVDPSANRSVMRETLDRLEVIGRESDVPIAVFPEGTRTPGGEIGQFKQGALSRLLRSRAWTVHIFVADDFWQAAKFWDLAAAVPDLKGKFVYAGCLQWTDPTADTAPFVLEARQVMIDALAEMRGTSTSA
jgi:1-acyl-sn-glycerol-3-phosphate acyltransferase